MGYAVENGIVHSTNLVLHMVHHCNLSCRSCAHLCPRHDDKYYVSPSQVYEDLSIFAQHCAPSWVTLSGGDPLLHPNLMEVVEAVRKSGICKRLWVETNGVLLPTKDDDFWRSVDVVRVSQYPGKEMPAEQMEWCQQQAQKHGVDLIVVHTSIFTETYSELGTSDQSLAQRIYDTCVMQFHFNSIENGYFFKCPRSIVFPGAFSDLAVPPVTDGLRIVDSPTFGQELVSFLTSPTPLLSCRHCLGNVGAPFPHEQVQRGDWQHLQERPTEEMVNWKLLTFLQRALAKGDSIEAGRSGSQLPRYAQDLAVWSANKTAIDKAVQVASRMARTAALKADNQQQ